MNDESATARTYAQIVDTAPGSDSDVIRFSPSNKLQTPKSFTMAVQRPSSLRILLVTSLLIGSCSAFSPLHLNWISTRRLSTSLSAKSSHEHHSSIPNPFLATAVLSIVLATASPLETFAYDSSDYASETVTKAVKSLNDAQGNADATFSAYEGIAKIITEGEGVGGNINYKGVQLDRGYIADEDTAIYNPGLTLLTESEKERLTEAVINARKAGLQQGTWTENNEVAYDFLKTQLDPLHMTELRGYLSIIPIYGAILYLVVLAVQQFARDLFPAAYLIAAAAIFVPIAALVALGPQ